MRVKQKRWWSRMAYISQELRERRGAFLILSAVVLVGCLTIVSLAVDIGFLNLTKQRMQNAVDAAALAASLEITNAINNAPLDTLDVTGYALAQARLEAARVAQLNGVFVDPDADVTFGKRTYDDLTGKYSVQWNASPSNVVKVVARRDNDDVERPDGKLQLFFSGVTGDRRAVVRTDAIAYVESRDIVVVHDFSRSMNFDSYFNDESNYHLADAEVIANLSKVWTDLQMPNTGNLTFTPEYLTVTNSSDGITASVEFQYDDLRVTSGADIQQVQVRYTNGSSHTFTGLSGNDVNINGNRDIETAWVTLNASGESDPVTVTESGVDVEFSGDRLTATINSPYRVREVYVGFTNGGDDYESHGSYGPYNYTYEADAPIDYMYLELLDGRSFWYYFDAPDGAGTVTIRFDDTDSAVKDYFNLTQSYPYQAGSWNGYIDHVRTYGEFRNRGYREKYGGLTLINYILKYYSSYDETKDLWKTRHYPFHAIKEGHFLFCDYLADLGFDDHIGMVSYDTNHRMEMVVNEPDPLIPYVDVRDEPITDDYLSIKDLMRYKQASHYSNSTNMGGGLKDGTLMVNTYSRPGSKKTILLMTDGNTNTMDSGESTSLPYGWSWNQLLDYDNDGSADYTTNSGHKRYVLRLAYEAQQAGIMIHTMSVGVDADRDLMEAIAHIGGGHHIIVPGGASVSDMEAQVNAGFHRIASFVPPATLLPEE